MRVFCLFVCVPFFGGVFVVVCVVILFFSCGGIIFVLGTNVVRVVVLFVLVCFFLVLILFMCYFFVCLVVCCFVIVLSFEPFVEWFDLVVNCICLFL